MRTIEFPFAATLPGEILRPLVPVKISNPETMQNIEVFALVDSGADECALPASFASILGHNLEKGEIRQVNTGNGVTTVYSHKTQIEMLDFSTGITVLDYMPNLSTPLLGVKSFLSQFILTLDFPEKSIKFQFPD